MFRTHKKRALAGKGRNFAGAGEDVALVSNASYPHRLNFYAEPPRAEIGIEEFETWAIDRLYGMLGSSMALTLQFSARLSRQHSATSLRGRWRPW